MKDQATRLLDQIDRLDGDTQGWIDDRQPKGPCAACVYTGWFKRDGQLRRVAFEATPTEIKALAFELEDRLEDKGYERQRINGKHEWCDMQAECDGFAWVPFAEHTDRIEAVILAAGKMGGE